MNMQNRGSESKQQRINHRIKRADIALIAVCLLTAVLLGVFFAVHREAGREVRIVYDGTELKRIELYSAQADSEAEADSLYYLITYRDGAVDVESFENRPEPKLSEGMSYNLISVTDALVIVEDADCRDQICVRHKPVSLKGESIICLPHRLVVEIVGSENKDVNLQDGKQGRNAEEKPGEPLDGVVR